MKGLSVLELGRVLLNGAVGIHQAAKSILMGLDHVGSRRQSCASLGDELGSLLLGLAQALFLESPRKRRVFLVGILGGREVTLLHELQADLAERLDWVVFPVTEKAGKEDFDVRVNTVAQPCLIAHQPIASATEGFEGIVVFGLIRQAIVVEDDSRFAIEKHFANAQKVEFIGGGLDVFALFLRLERVDT